MESVVFGHERDNDFFVLCNHLLHLLQINICGYRKTCSQLSAQAEYLWRKYFKIGKLAKFNWSFTTIGFQACIIQRVKQMELGSQQLIDHILNRYHNDEYEIITSCDPDQWMMMGIVELNTATNLERFYRTIVHRRDVGEFRRNDRIEDIKIFERSFQYRLQRTIQYGIWLN